MAITRVCMGLLAGGVLVTTTCGPLHRSRDQGERAGQNGVSMENGALILSGEALRDGSGSVLGAMAGKVPNFRVRNRSGSCPEITLRSSANYRGFSNPHVYVDGTRATDTCILEALRTTDVERVEVYPAGFTNRPGYGTHGPGLILVFMRSADRP